MSKDNDFRYVPLKEDEFNILWDKHKKIIESFIEKNQYDVRYLYINQNTVMSVIAKVHQRKKYFEYFHGLEMSDCKEVALICFWYIKLRPICAASKDLFMKEMEEFNYINEKLAVYYILTALQGLLEEKNLPVEPLENINKDFVRELIYSFRYRDISKEALILLVEGMASFLGLNPYNNKKLL